MNKNVDTLLIELTQKCNLNCQYCFYRDYGRKKEEITIEKLNNIISEYPNLKDIYLTGGECTLANDFLGIIKKASGQAKVTVFTNGILFANKDYLNEVDKYISKYIVTYDEYDDSYFCRDKIKETDAALKNIIEVSSQKLVVKICINRFNKDNLKNIIEYLISIGVVNLSLNVIHNIKNSDEHFEISKSELKEIFGLLDLYQNMFDANYYEKLKAFFIEERKDLVKYCRAGNTFLYYNCLGNCFYCPAEYTEKKDCMNKECICLFEMF